LSIYNAVDGELLVNYNKKVIAVSVVIMIV